MSVSVATVKFSNDKTCFVSLSSGITNDTNLNKDRKDLVFEIDNYDGSGRKIYVSWSGDTVRAQQTDEHVIQMNGIFADKLGLKEKQQVVMRPLNTKPVCVQVHVEPVSSDDWEIFDRNADFIEGKLLNQVRVVQKGVVYPIWVEKMCVFIKIGAINPDAECCLLVNETEVIVEPKVRGSVIGPPVIEEPISKAVTSTQEAPLVNTISPQFTDEEAFDTKFHSTDSEQLMKELDPGGSQNNRKRDKSPYDFTSISGHWRHVISTFLGFQSTANSNKVMLSEDEEDDYDDYYDYDLDEADDFYTSEKTEKPLPPASNLILRVQALKYTSQDSDNYSPQSENRRGNMSPRKNGAQSPRKNGSVSPRKGSRDSPSRSNRNLSNSSKSNFRINYFPQQPSTIYMDKSDLEKQVKINRQDIPSMFYAKIRKLSSPKDQQYEKSSQMLGGSKNNLRKDSKLDKDKISPGSTNSMDTPESPTSPEILSQSSGLKASDFVCIVRVIVVDRRRQLSNDSYSDIVKRIMEEQPLLRGHVIVPDMLRRMLKLDLTSRLWIQTFKAVPLQSDAFTLYPLGNLPLLRGHVIVPDMLRRMLKLDLTSRLWIQTFKAVPLQSDAFTLYPLGNLSKKITSENLVPAFKRWLDYVSSDEYPLVVYQGIFLRFEVVPDTFVEVQLTYNEKYNNSRSSHVLLHPGSLQGKALSIISGSRTSELTHPAVQPMLAYTSIQSIDPVVPHTDITMIGGMTELIQTALSNIEICLGSRPLYKEVFLTTPGLLNGMLLLTGQKGSGKTTLVKALCRELMQLPNLAYTNVIDCKPLRGKKVDTIQKIFEVQFDEAAWRQPSLIVFDDLDHIAGAPAGPEFEMSGEALYAGRVAEGASAGPEFEMSGEALYASRVAEVVKDLLRKDIRNMTHVAVLATSQSRSSLHSILVSSRGAHLVQEVMNIRPPDKTQREDILRTIMQKKTTISGSSLNDLDLAALSLKMEGYVARDLENIVNRAIHAHVLNQGRATHRDLDIEITQQDFENAMLGFTPASIRNVPLHQAGELGWDDVGGLTDVKETLVETLQWPTKYPVLFSNCPLRLRSGLLLYGAPGTGKTLLAGVVAKECGLNFISIKGPELLSKYIGASEQAVRDTFVRAQSAKPCILFFDEFDSIAPRRGHDNTGVTDRVVNQLLTQLDGVEGLDGVYVLAATSRPDLIDPALLRPGRLDKCLHCQMPNKEERLKILKALSLRMNLSDDVDFQHFANSCEDFTGADFKALLYNAQLEAIHEFTAQTVSDPSSNKFGMKKSAAARFKNRAKKAVTTDTVRERRKSFSGTYAYIPSLEEGIVNITADIEEKLSTQVSQIQVRERRSSEHIPGDDKPDSPYLPTKLITVHHSHMMSAVAKMRPSVTGDEKLKYQRIYENFLSAREGSFNMGYMEAAEMMKNMKATLA